MPDNGCPVNAAISDLDRIVHSGTLKYPKSRRRTEEILALMQDIAWGRAGKDHLPSLKILIDELGDEGQDGICKTVSTLISRTLTEHHEVFVSHVETHNCATGDCVKLAPAPCQMTCPAGLDIPTYVTLIGMGRDAEAMVREEARRCLRCDVCLRGLRRQLPHPGHENGRPQRRKNPLPLRNHIKPPEINLLR